MEGKTDLNKVNIKDFVNKMKNQYEYAVTHGKELIAYTDKKLNTTAPSTQNWMKQLEDAHIKYKVVDNKHELLKRVK